LSVSFVRFRMPVSTYNKESSSYCLPFIKINVLLGPMFLISYDLIESRHLPSLYGAK
jgi:hypothetical protein